ncbi:MAG: hypothetical protein ACOC4C_00575 [Fibrobacterota bacterium]
MKSVKNAIKIVVAGGMIATVGLTGCTKRPSEEELAKLEEARSAAESAERKLAELRKERMDLESQLAEKESELQLHEEEKADLKQKMENQ